MGTNHWFKFPFQRWLSDPAVRKLSQASRCTLFDTICRLASADEPGIMRLDLDVVARLVPCHVNQLGPLALSVVSETFPLGDWLRYVGSGKRTPLLTYIDAEHRSHDVLVQQQGPIIMAPFILVDAWKYARSREIGRRGGNPKLVQSDRPGGLTPPVNPPLSVLSCGREGEEERGGAGGKGHRGSGHTDLLALGAAVRKANQRKDRDA